jgi:hypothetical protein
MSLSMAADPGEPFPLLPPPLDAVFEGLAPINDDLQNSKLIQTNSRWLVIKDLVFLNLRFFHFYLEYY